MTAKRFQSLDGLRGVCALTVVLLHSDDLFHKGPIFQHGYLSVDMFFLLSGFVIALVHEERLKAGAGLAQFLRSRARRLLPVYWLGAAFNIAVFVWMVSSGYYVPGYTWTMVWIIVPLTTLFMLPAWGTVGDSFSPAMLNVSWSLLVEWIVNIAYAAFAFRLRTRTLALLILAGWLGMAVAGYLHPRGWCVGISRNECVSLGTLRGAPSFLAGVALYRLHALGRFSRLPIIAPELLLTAWLCIAVVPTYTATPTFDWIAVTIFCPLLMLLLLRSDHLAPGFCKVLGELSYPLYVIHPGILLLAMGTPLFGLNRGPDIGRATLVVCLCVAAAWLVARLAEGWPRRQPLEAVKAAA